MVRPSPSPSAGSREAPNTSSRIMKITISSETPRLGTGGAYDRAIAAASAQSRDEVGGDWTRSLLANVAMASRKSLSKRTFELGSQALYRDPELYEQLYVRRRDDVRFY